MKLNPDFTLDRAAERELFSEMKSFVSTFHGSRKDSVDATDKDILYGILLMLSKLSKRPDIIEFATTELAWLQKLQLSQGGFSISIVRFIEEMEQLRRLRDPERIADHCVLEAIDVKRKYLAHDKRDSWVNKLSIIWLWLTLTFIKTNVNYMLANEKPIYRDVLKGTLALVNVMVAFDVQRLNSRNIAGNHVSGIRSSI